MRVAYHQQRVLVKGKTVSFDEIKSLAFNHVSIEYMDRFILNRKFNPESGAIVRKYAWDSAIESMQKDGILIKIVKEALGA